MTTAYWNLAGGDLTQDWTNTEQITITDSWAGVASITGYRGDNLTPGTGTDPQTITGASDVVNVFANQTLPNSFNSGGVAEFEIANPTIALNGSGTADAPYIQLFLDATGRQGVTLSFNARDLDGSGDNATQQIAVQYRIGETGAWTNLPAGYIADATTAGTATQVTPVTVTLPAVADGAAQVQLRVITSNAVGNDEWVGIDDIVVTSAPAVGDPDPVPGTLSIAGATVTEGDSGATDLVFTVTRANGDDGAVSATWTATLPGGATGADAADLAPGQPLTGTVSFADGQTSATITLQVAGDTAFEATETLSLTLSAPTGGASLGTATATGTIANDDAAPPAAPANVFINEIHYDNTGTDTNEAVEIAGTAGQSLAGWSIALYRTVGTVYDTIALSGTIDDEGQGYGALSFPRAGIQNGVAGLALVDANGGVVQFLSYEGSITATAGPAVGLTSTTIGVAEEPVPAAGQSLQLKGSGSSAGDFAWATASDDSFGDLNDGQTFLPATGTGQLRVGDASVVEGNDGTTSLVFTIRRAGGQATAATVDYQIALDGTADAADLAPGAVLAGTVSFAEGEFTKQIEVAVRGDTAGERNETLSLTLGATTGDVTVEDGAAVGTIVNDDPVTLTIAEIQGAGHRSEFAGQTVVTTGIVTAVRNAPGTNGNAFYLQMATGDGDDATSDAIYVYLRDIAPTVVVGDAVTVTGTVTEFASSANQLTLTEITTPTVVVTAQAQELPDAVVIGAGGRTPPTEVFEDDGFTSFDPATDGLDFYESLEGMLVTVDTPLVVSTTVGNAIGEETYVVASNGAGATGLNDRGGITVSEGDFNPERIQLLADATVFSGYNPDHTTGDWLASVTGVVNYGGGDYSVVVTEAVTVTEDVTLPRETTTIAGDQDRLSVATFNVENLDPTDTKFDILASDIVYNLRAPDIIAVQEIQDADGAGSGSNLSGTVTAQRLIDAIRAESGLNYAYVEVAPSAPNTTGGEPNGNIRNGYFYNIDRVDYVDGSAALIDGAVYAGTRRPLVAQFSFNDQTVTLVNVHLTSRIGSDPLFGSVQPPANAGDGARTQQLAGVKTYVDGLLAADPNLNIGILGDFNGFYFEESQLQLTRDGSFVNLASLLPEEERYSFLFEGNTQLLDNILVTGGLVTGAQYDAVHLNSQLTGTRPTDHDPQVATFLLEAANRAPTAADDIAAVNEDAATANLYATLLANDTDPDAGTTLSMTAVGTAGTLGTVEFDAATRTLRYLADDDAFDALAPGETLVDRFTYTVSDGEGGTSTATVAITVTGVADGVTRTGTARVDVLNGTADEDVISGLAGSDEIRGGAGNDTLSGDDGADFVYGDAGDDLLFGGLGNDRLFGGDGDDVFNGDAGSDFLTLGAGADTIRIGAGDGLDTVNDFDVTADRIVLEDGVRVTASRSGDVNRDGIADLQITLSSGASLKLFGVSSLSSVTIENDTAASAPFMAAAIHATAIAADGFLL